MHTSPYSKQSIYITSIFILGTFSSDEMKWDKDSQFKRWDKGGRSEKTSSKKTKYSLDSWGNIRNY